MPFEYNPSKIPSVITWKCKLTSFLCEQVRQPSHPHQNCAKHLLFLRHLLKVLCSDRALIHIFDFLLTMNLNLRRWTQGSMWAWGSWSGERAMHDSLTVLILRESHDNDRAITVMEAVITDTPKTTPPRAFRSTKPCKTSTTPFAQTLIVQNSALSRAAYNNKLILK